MYPEFAEIKGKQYPLNTDYKTALKCFEVINDEDISDSERSLAVIYLLFGFIPDENAELFLEKATLFLQCGKPPKDDDDTIKDIDFNYDAGFIMASFMSDYHLDLPKTNMHFWQYVELIAGLTDKCVLSRVRDIRNKDLSEIKDEKARADTAKAQENLKLPVRLTAKEKAAIEKFESLFGDN